MKNLRRRHLVRSQQKKTSKRRLCLERMEDRRLLAGDITIDFEDGVGHTAAIPQGQYAGLAIQNGAWIQPNINPFVFHDGNYGLGAVSGDTSDSNSWARPTPSTPIAIRFASPVVDFGITAYDVGVNGAKATAFDSLGAVVYTKSVFGSGAGQGNNVRFEISDADISRVELSLVQIVNTDGVGWDNLTYSEMPEFDIVASARWNPSEAGITVSYDITGDDVTETPTYGLYWADGDGKSLRTIVQDVEITESTVGSKGEAFIGSETIGIPPTDATQVVFQIDAQDSEPLNNTARLKWNPVVTVGATIDGNQDENVVGRYFKGVDIPNLNMTVELSESLAALKPDLVSLNPANKAEELTYFKVPGENLLYEVFENEFAPEMDIAKPKTFSVDAVFNEVTLASDSATIDTIRLPKWLKRADVSYSPASGGYLIEKQLFDIDTKKKFRLPREVEGVDLWFGAKLNNGVTASASINIDAELNPTAQPSVGASAKTDIVLLGKTIDEREDELFDTQIALELDARTLDFLGGNLDYTIFGSFDNSFDLDGVQFPLGPLTLRPEITKAVLDYSIGVFTEFDSDGRVDKNASKVMFDIDAEFEGNLSIDLKGAKKIAKIADEFVSILGVAGTGVGGLFLDAIDRVLEFPTFDVTNSFKSNIELDGVMNFKGKKESFSGEVSVSESKTSITFDPGFLENFGFKEEDLGDFDNGLAYRVPFQL